MPDRLRILCVDDDEDALFIASLSLRLDPDIAVIVSRSGADALGILAASPTGFSCLLVEERMAGMSGSALLTLVKNRFDPLKLPVVFLTASVSDAEAARYMPLGATGIIPKPYDPLTLAAQVRALLAAR